MMEIRKMCIRDRIGAHLRREKREHVARLALGRICFMLEARKMMIDEKEISLTKAEYDICEFLAKNRGQIFSKEQILEKVLGYDLSLIHIYSERLLMQGCRFRFAQHCQQNRDFWKRGKENEIY